MLYFPGKSLPLFILCLIPWVTVLGDTFLIQDLLKRYTETYGGLRDANRLASLRLEGIQLQDGVEYRMTLHKKRPASIRYQLDSGDVSITAVYNGEQAWLRMKQGSEVEIEEPSASGFAMLEREARFESPLYRHLEKSENSITLVGREQMDRVTAVVLRVAEPNHRVSHYYLDPTSAYLLRVDCLNEEGEVFFQTLYRDYRIVEGYPFAFEIENRVNNATVALTRLKSITVNPGLLSFYFEKPTR